MVHAIIKSEGVEANKSCKMKSLERDLVDAKLCDSHQEFYQHRVGQCSGDPACFKQIANNLI